MAHAAVRPPRTPSRRAALRQRRAWLSPDRGDGGRELLLGHVQDLSSWAIKIVGQMPKAVEGIVAEPRIVTVDAA